MSALSIFQAQLIKPTANKSDPGVPLTADVGGTSEGDASAGTGDPTNDMGYHMKPIETKDKVAAAITTLGFGGLFGSMMFWIVSGE